MASDPAAPSRRLRRLLNAPLLFVAVFVVLLDDLFRAFVIPAVQALARLALIRRLEAFIARLSPTAILLLFVIPLAVIEPFKIYALYLLGEGHILSAILMFVLAKIVGLGLAERLFAIGRDKLLSIHWFAWCHGRALAIRGYVHGWLARTRTWQRAMRAVHVIRSGLAAVRRSIIRLAQNGRKGRLAAARRRVRHYRTA